VGAVTLSYFIRRVATSPAHNEKIAWDFAAESVAACEMHGLVATAASIGDAAMAERCLREGAHIVATPPQVFKPNIWAFARWLAGDVPSVVQEADTCHVTLTSERLVLTYEELAREQGGNLEFPSSPLLKAGYRSFLEAHLKAAWTVCQYIQRMAAEAQ
jgi:hypothetical protein